MLIYSVFFLLVCDNCTLTLLERTDDLRYMLNAEWNEVDLDGIPAPWPRLLTFENVSVFLETKLDNYLDSKDRLEDFNDLAIEKVKNKCFIMFEDLEFFQPKIYKT